MSASKKEKKMFKRRHPLRAIIDRGALVLFLLCQLNILALADTNPASVFATGLRTTVEGAATRITVTGTAPLAHSVRHIDDHTLLVEMPGVDAGKLSSSYLSASPLVAGMSVRCDKTPSGSPVARLIVILNQPARERSYLAANDLVLELTPTSAPTATPTASEPQARPTPNPAPTPNILISNPTAGQSSGMAPNSQGQHYGEYGFVGEPINLNVVNADIRDILNYITEQYGVNFIIDSSVGAVPVTVNVTEVPWNLALDSILRANRLGIEVTGNILRVATLKVLAEEAESQKTINEAKLEASPLVTEFIRLNYARAVGTLAQAAGSTGGFSGGSSNQSFSGGSGGDSTGKSGDQGILPIVARRLSKRGSVEVDGRSNTLIVTDVRENIASIRQLVSLLDQPEPQVEIEVRIVIANRNFSRDLGVQISALAVNTGNGASGSFATVPGSQLPGSTGQQGTFPESTLIPGGIPNGINLAPTRGLGASAPSTVIGLTTGIIGTAQISALITAAETKGQAKIVANPRVTALNNRPAQIESGSQIPVVSPQSGNGGSGAVVFTTTFISVPLRLSVTPQITDAGTVVLRITAENNTVNLSLTNSLGTPGIDTQRMQTEVLVPDGGTTIIGGVLADSEGETQSRTPGLGGLPVIGNLFKRRTTNRTTNELLFFITPRIYRPDYSGRPMAGTVSDRTRSTSIPQPVPLGNPQSNTPPPFGTAQPTQQPQQQQTPPPESQGGAPVARPTSDRPPMREED
ncbi:MAG: type pilus assembly protein PilQ [Acidobacteriota bacterium]|jgi:type IV pilus assembly protein PilQ|nr:type pilus assembly protein PilQ [Acidobacteriota bacterium]